MHGAWGPSNRYVTQSTTGITSPIIHSIRSSSPKGVDWFDDRGSINLRSGGGAPGTGKTLTTNFNVERFEVLDWTLIGRLVVSFVCMVLAYDAFSGERERGTLRLLFANPISREQVLIGKFLTAWTCVLVPVVAGGAVALAIMSVQGAVDLDGRIGLAVLSYLLSTALFTALVLLLSMGASALAASSATSLAFLMLIWAGLTVVVPQVSYVIGVNAMEVLPWWGREDSLFRGDVVEELAKEGLSPRGREHGAHDNYAREREFAQRLDASEKLAWQRRRAALQEQVAQYELISSTNLISPGYAYSQSVEALLGTGITRFWVFLDRVHDWGRTMRGFLQARDAADPDSPHVVFLADYMSEGELDHRNIPPFPRDPAPPWQALRYGMVPIVMLLMETLGAFLFARWAVRRMSLM